MKTFRNSLLVSGIVFLLLSSCTSSISLEVLQPARINIHQDIKKLLLVNRYRPEKGKGFLNFLEGLFSGEGIGEDRRGAEESLSGLTNALAGSPRFIINRPGVELRGRGLGSFPPPLTIAEVQNMCQRYGGDALVTIEAFDSDSRIEYSRDERTRKNKEGVKETYYVTIADASINIRVGWRLYDGQRGTLIDEAMMSDRLFFTGEGRNEQAARNNLPSRELVIRDIGALMGDGYARRIAPTYIRVSRSWYTKGSDAMKQARDRAKADQWEEARVIWERIIDNASKDKTRGRAAFNMGLYYELIGDLESARQWAQEAAGKYGLGNGRNYARTLARRIDDQRRLQEQMKGAPK